MFRGSLGLPLTEFRGAWATPGGPLNLGGGGPDPISGGLTDFKGVLADALPSQTRRTRLGNREHARLVVPIAVVLE